MRDPLPLSRRSFLASSAAALALPFEPPLPSPRLIDSHVHVFERSPAFPYAAGSHPPAQDASVETLLELMRANGVSHTVLIQVIHYRWDNRYVASVLKRYPGTFQAVCRVDPEEPAAPDHLSDLTQQGFRGVRLSPSEKSDGDWIRGPLMPPLWRRCAELKVPMTLLIPVSRIPDVIPLIEANPSLTVVIDHMAGCPVDRPDQLKMLLDLARYPRVLVKISGLWAVSKQPFPYPDAMELVKRLHQAFGASRLMWATNWPVSLEQIAYPDAVRLYRDNLGFLTASEREDVLFRTANRIWPFPTA